MNAKKFLKAWIDSGTGTNLELAAGVIKAINDTAVLDTFQQQIVREAIQLASYSRDQREYVGRMIQIATYINSCH